MTSSHDDKAGGEGSGWTTRLRAIRLDATPPRTSRDFQLWSYDSRTDEHAVRERELRAASSTSNSSMS